GDVQPGSAIGATPGLPSPLLAGADLVAGQVLALLPDQALAPVGEARPRSTVNVTVPAAGRRRQTVRSGPSATTRPATTSGSWFSASSRESVSTRTGNESGVSPRRSVPIMRGAASIAHIAMCA